MEMVRGGLRGLKRTRNPLKAPRNTLQGLKAGLARGAKRKAEQVIKKEISKRAKKALSNKNVKQARAGGQCPLSQTDQESARHFWGLKRMMMKKKRMPPVHSRLRFTRSNRGLPQYGGWLAASVKRLPDFDLVQQLSRRQRRYKNPSTRRPVPSRRRRRRRRR